ncbi:hypothetical protein [Celeribacter indicus]|uniref:Uncharacterized protein n=1 Tax=Celeribacter indicus TaxID=1208324 RepID=A0A0B5DXJ6_9RHOB|nr:hypothetical protein [Celeribacter indicus]AJE47709.1 hypothetical protein P73_2994 [Celeribacter indicus]SDW14875.1 hypothetical protein SAMN05443573_101556 [Celeribacter indicus]
MASDKDTDRDIVIADLTAALEAARAGEAGRVERLTERIRDRSYQLEPRQAAYMVRAACTEIERVLRMADEAQGVWTALSAIARVEDMFRRVGSASDAA